MRRVALVPLAVLALVAPASAADRVGTPARVAETPAPGGRTAVLEAQDASGGGLCLDVTLGTRKLADGICPAPPRSARDDLAPLIGRFGGTSVLYGATTSGTRSVELLLRSGRLLAADTDTGDYAGRFADAVRFYAAAVKGSPRIGAVTARNRSGDVRAVQ